MNVTVDMLDYIGDSGGHSLWHSALNRGEIAWLLFTWGHIATFWPL